MATKIITRTIGGVEDRKFVLGNAFFGQEIAIGSSWTTVRVALRFAFTDAGAGISTPKFWFGLLSNPSLSNSVQHAATSHFVGLRGDTATTFARTAGPPPYYTATGRIVKRVGAVETAAATGTSYFSADPTVRNLALVQVTKGSPNWTIQVGRCGAAGATVVDRSLDFLRAGMEVESFSSAVSALALSALPTLTNAVSEATDGPLNAIHVAWDRTVAVLEISDIAWALFP